MVTRLIGNHGYMKRVIEEEHLNSARFETHLGHIWPTPIVGEPRSKKNWCDELIEMVQYTICNSDSFQLLGKRKRKLILIFEI